MHADLREAIIASVRRRFEQGDCPTEPAHTVETLEHVILDLSPKPPAGGGTEEDRRYELAVALFQAAHGARLVAWSDTTRDYWLKRADAALAKHPTSPEPAA